MLFGSSGVREALRLALAAPTFGSVLELQQSFALKFKGEKRMEYRRLGASGLTVPALSFGTGTFGGVGRPSAAWGNTDATEARRLLDICFDAGVVDVRYRGRVFAR